MADFYNIDSIEKAIELADEGVLEAIYLFPIQFGGEEEMFNVAFVPEGISEIKAEIDDFVERLLVDGLAASYECNIDRKENSVVPSKLTIVVKNDKDEVIFNNDINIW